MLFSVVATFSLLFRESTKAFLLVASSDKVFTCRDELEQKGNKKVKKLNYWVGALQFYCDEGTMK